MINRLIDIEIPPINKEAVVINQPITNSNFTIKDYATAFLEGMGETQKARFKKMLENDIKCGLSVAENYGIDYDDFILEVKKQMEVE